MNPFRYSGPVGPEDVIDREQELRSLLSTADSANNSRLLAPREFGKTSLLRKLLHLADKQGWVTVYVDFFGILTLADAAQRVENAYREQFQGDLATWFESVRRRFTRGQLGGGPVPGSVEVDLSPQAEQPLIDRLATPKQVLERRGLRSLIVFDEFQDVLSAREDADEVIRAEIQHHGEAASYVFAGSEIGMMRELFADRRRAFFRQAQRVDLKPLDDADLGEYISELFRASGRLVEPAALSALLDRVEGHPRTAMLLAHELWERVPADGAADIQLFDAAERAALEKAAADLRGLWRGLSKSQRGLLTTLARGEKPYSRNRSDAGNGGSTTQKAIAALVDAGELVEVAGGGYRIVDPFFAELLRRDWSP